MIRDTREQRFLADVRAALARHVADRDGACRYVVAFSGGLDSTVLLAAMARIEPPSELKAVHVDHGLHSDSAIWARHCARVAAALGVSYASVRVTVDCASGAGLEAAAREARYAAFAALVGDGEVLLTAHHADDQLETLLLRLLRGTGVRGLRGILAAAPLGRGRVVRPLLGVTRAAIRACAESWGLEWLEDPSNASLEHDRNYLRQRVLPPIRDRWPAAALGATRLATAMADAEQLLAAAARADLGGATGGEPIPLGTLRRLDGARLKNALRHAIRDGGLPIPTARQLEELVGALGVERADARTLVSWPGAEARIYRDRLYLLAPRGDRTESGEDRALAAAGFVSAAAAWAGEHGRLALVPAAEPPSAAQGLPESWAREGFEVRFRAGGERFKPAGDAHTRSLKHWYQQQAVVPWMRDRIPLLYRHGRLVAVADLAIDEEACRAGADEPRWRVRWSAHPPIR